MTTVTEDLDLPAGTAPELVTVTVELVGANGESLREAYDLLADKTITGHRTAEVGATGTWQLDNLTGNDAITPSGTVWRRTVQGPSVPRTYSYADIPAAGGPYVWADRLADPPAAIAPSALAAHASDSLLHGGGQLLGYGDRDTNFVTASTSPVDVPGVTTTFIVPDRPYIVEVGSLCLFEEGIAGQAAVTSGSRTSGLTTLNTAAAHGFSVGQVVVVKVADTTYNGAFAIASVLSATSFTYAQTGAANDASSGTGFVGRADQPAGGGNLGIFLADNTQIGVTGERGQIDNDLLYISRRIPVPNHFHAPTPGTSITYKMRAWSTAATSDLSLIASFFGTLDAPYVLAHTL